MGFILYVKFNRFISFLISVKFCFVESSLFAGICHSFLNNLKIDLVGERAKIIKYYEKYF